MLYFFVSVFRTVQPVLGVILSIVPPTIKYYWCPSCGSTVRTPNKQARVYLYVGLKTQYTSIMVSLMARLFLNVVKTLPSNRLLPTTMFAEPTCLLVLLLALRTIEFKNGSVTGRVFVITSILDPTQRSFAHALSLVRYTYR